MLVRAPHRLLATFIVLQLACGDLVRNLLGWPLWGALSGVTLLWALVALRRSGASWQWLPAPLLAFIGVAAATIIVTPHPLATLLGVALLLVHVMLAVLLATLPLHTLLEVLHRCLQGMLIASLAFEVGIALFVQGPVYPVWLDNDSGLPMIPWSTGGIFWGHRIQGITGNPNLTAMLALLALIVAIGRHRAGLDRRLWWVWTALPVVVLALTRSMTVLVAALVVLVSFWLVYTWRRRPRGAFRPAVVAAAGVLAVVAAWAISNWDRVVEALGREASMEDRFQIWAAALDWWRGSPLLGRGWMGYWMPWVEPYDRLGLQDGIVYLQAHSVWIDMLMQAGILGVLAWAWLLGSTLRGAGRDLAEAPTGAGPIAAVPLMILVAEAVQGIAESRPLIELGMVLLVIFAVRQQRARVELGRLQTMALPLPLQRGG